MSASLKRLLLTLCLCMAISSPAQSETVLVSAIDGAITHISREEAEQLYLGRLSSLRDGTPVRLLDLAPGATRNAFYQGLIGKNPTQTRAYWSRIVFTGRARPPREVAGPEELRDAINQDPNLVGYVPIDGLSTDMRILLRVD